MPGPRTPLLRPKSYFESHDGSPPLKHAALDATVEVENPDHTPEWACENFAESGMSTPSGCDPSVPETVERDLGSIVYEELSWLLWTPLFLVPVFWAVHAPVLHAGGAVVGGEGAFADRSRSPAGGWCRASPACSASARS